MHVEALVVPETASFLAVMRSQPFERPAGIGMGDPVDISGLAIEKDREDFSEGGLEALDLAADAVELLAAHGSAVSHAVDSFGWHLGRPAVNVRPGRSQGLALREWSPIFTSGLREWGEFCPIR